MFLTTIAMLVLGGPTQSARTTDPFIQVQTASKPISFTCKHCGRKITLGAQSDMGSKCKVCKCGKTNAQCKPTGGN